MDYTRETITAEDAAHRMGCRPSELMERMRFCCLNRINFPLGFALPPASKSELWTYIIPRRRFEMYMSGDDLRYDEPNVI
jgi:hypothetical protein